MSSYRRLFTRHIDAYSHFSRDTKFSPMFKKTKRPEREEAFKKPKLRETREIKTHLKERTPIERIFYLFPIQNKRKAVFRMILGLEQSELDKNVYMLAESLLQTLLIDEGIEKLFYAAFGRIIRSTHSQALNELCYSYVKAQMSYDRGYTTFLEFLIRHFRTALAGHEAELGELVIDEALKHKLLSLRPKDAFQKLSCNELFYYTRC